MRWERAFRRGAYRAVRPRGGLEPVWAGGVAGEGVEGEAGGERMEGVGAVG